MFCTLLDAANVLPPYNPADYGTTCGVAGTDCESLGDMNADGIPEDTCCEGLHCENLKCVDPNYVPIWMDSPVRQGR